MQYPIPQAAAFVFARDFYRSVALGYPLEAAVTEGRRGIYLESGGEGDWAIPVLFLRAQDGTLFGLPQAEPAGAANGGPGAPAVQIGDVASGGMVIAGPVSGVAAYHISGPVISNVTGDVHVTQAAPIEIQPAPAPTPPPAPTSFVGRDRELALYTEIVRTTGRIVITGMPGVGKTAMAAKVALSAASAPKIFWHTFRTGEGVDLLLWELAGFAAWHGKADLWQLLQRSPQPPPHETLVVSLLHALRGQGFVLTLDDLQYVDEDPALAASIKRLSVAIDSRELALVATADRLPANIQVATAEVLGGFSLADTRLFLEARSVVLNERLSAELQAKTSGNVELLNLAANVLQQATDPQRLIDRLAEVENIGHYLLNEVDQGLTGAERRVMGALAVLGGLPSRADAVEAVLDGDNPRRTMLKLSSRYLVSTQMGAEEQEYAIPAILQAFYYGELGRRERTAMHARAGAYYVQVEQNYLRRGPSLFRCGRGATRSGACHRPSSHDRQPRAGARSAQPAGTLYAGPAAAAGVGTGKGQPRRSLPYFGRPCARAGLLPRSAARARPAAGNAGAAGTLRQGMPQSSGWRCSMRSRRRRWSGCSAAWRSWRGCRQLHPVRRPKAG